MIPLVAGAMVGGQLGTRSVGYRPLVTVALVILTSGLFLLTTITATSSLTMLMEFGAVMGFGMGITFPVVILAIQYSVSRRQIGIASSLAQFTRNLGGTIGLSVLGAIQVNAFGSQLSSVLQAAPQAAAFLGDPNTVGRILADPATLAHITQSAPAIALIVPMLRAAFATSVVPLFWAGLIVSAASIAAGLFITGSFKQQVIAREAMHLAENAGLGNVPPIIETEKSN